MSKPKVIVTRRWPEKVEQVLPAHFDVQLNEDDHPFTRAELEYALQNADALFSTVTDRLDGLGLPEEQRDILAAIFATSCHCSPAEASALEMLRWYSLPGASLQNYADSVGRYWLRGGTRTLIERMLADGRPELRLSTAIRSVRHGADEVVVIRSGAKGDGPFRSPEKLELPTAPYGSGAPIVVADVNRDGDLDLIVHTAYGYCCLFERSFIESGYARGVAIGMQRRPKAGGRSALRRSVGEGKRKSEVSETDAPGGG